MGEIIRGKVSEVKRETHSITSEKRVEWSLGTKVDTELVTKTIFKLENDNRTFLLEGGELIEQGDELGFYANANKDGFYKVLLCKNFTRTWFKDYAGMGLWSLIKSLLGIAVLSYIIYLILIYLVFDNRTLGNIISAIVFILLEAMAVFVGLSDLKLKNKIKNMT